MKQKYKRRVAITGMGAVTPVGNTLSDTWNGIMEGARTVGPVAVFHAEKFPCTFAYQVRNFELVTPIGCPLPPVEYLNRAGQFGWNAACEALAQASLLTNSKDDATAQMRRKMALCLGVGVGSPDLKWYQNVYMKKNGDDPSTRFHRKDYPSTLTSVLSTLIGARGGNHTIHTACASSGQSLGEAYELIASGEYDAVLTGGADSMVNPFQMAGFCLLGALSTRNQNPKEASRPFDNDRDGFVLGEGAAMFVFEEWDHALARGAKILGEICGYGVTESAYRITDLHPEGRGTIEAMEMALEDARIRPSDVGYINAHGTSTLLNDRIESLAISKVFPKDQCDVVVSSTKSSTGHLISAAGALEFAVANLSLNYQMLPPSLNIFKQDPLCDIHLSPPTPHAFKSNYALSNSIGFGGSNTSLIARRLNRD